jgi:hypothetical protein
MENMQLDNKSIDDGSDTAPHAAAKGNHNPTRTHNIGLRHFRTEANGYARIAIPALCRSLGTDDHALSNRWQIHNHTTKRKGT